MSNMQTALSLEKALVILKMPLSIPARVIAREYGVSEETIRRLRRGEGGLGRRAHAALHGAPEVQREDEGLVQKRFQTQFATDEEIKESARRMMERFEKGELDAPAGKPLDAWGVGEIPPEVQARLDRMLK